MRNGVDIVMGVDVLKSSAAVGNDPEKLTA
jgi:hypothetical protein